MYRVIYTVQAEEDLRNAVETIAGDNLTAALSWLDRTEAIFELLASQPALGQRMVTRRFGEVRQHTSGNYVIYYRLADEGLQILRVLHAARDSESLL
jgi:toxin ParE1/3/4